MSLRIVSGRSTGPIRAAAANVSGPVGSYMERLVKLVPGEAMTAYPILHTFAQKSDLGVWPQQMVVVVIFLVVAILRWHQTRIPGKPKSAQWLAIGIACVTFLLFILSQGNTIGLEQIYTAIPALPESPSPEQLAAHEQATAKVLYLKESLVVASSILLVAWALVMPALYKGDKQH